MPKTLKVEAFEFDELSEKAKEKARDWFREADCGDSRDIEESLDQTLEAAGLDGFKLGFSLGYCQGDGVDFTGQVDLDEFIKVQDEIAWQVANKQYRSTHFMSSKNLGEGVVVGAKVVSGVSQEGIYIRLDPDSKQTITSITPLPEDKVKVVTVAGEHDKYIEYLDSIAIDVETLAAMKDLKDKSIDYKINIKHYGRYTHWNSMQVEEDVYGYGAIDDMDVDEMEPDTHEKAVKAIYEIVSVVVLGFRDYVKQLSRVLEREGYEIIEWSNSDETVEENIKANDYLFTESGSRRYVLDASNIAA